MPTAPSRPDPSCVPCEDIVGYEDTRALSPLLPSALVVVSVVTGSEATSSVGIVWFAHIGMDRALA
jgi:hypothetical protein